MGANVTVYAVPPSRSEASLAGSAGVLVGPISFANPYLGETYGIYGFIALMIGGIERPAASMGGGFVLGILATLASTYINPQASDWFPLSSSWPCSADARKGIFMSGDALRRHLVTVWDRKPSAPSGPVL